MLNCSVVLIMYVVVLVSPSSDMFSLVSWGSTVEQESEERKCNYERYRGLVQNDFANSEWH